LLSVFDSVFVALVSVVEALESEPDPSAFTGLEFASVPLPESFEDFFG